jgi:hypothetical protein
MLTDIRVNSAVIDPFNIITEEKHVAWYFGPNEIGTEVLSLDDINLTMGILLEFIAKQFHKK